MLAQRLAHHAADPAVADEHDVIGKPRHRDRLAAARFRRRPRLGVVGLHGAPHRQAVDKLHQQRIDEDRDNGAGENEVARLSRQDRQRHAEPGEDEGKLADLREADRDGKGGRQRMAE